MNKENFPKINFKLGLYPIVNNIEWISRLLKLGVQILQLRIKNANFQEIESEVHDSIILSKKYNACLFINDYWQLAIKYNAYGVHLGQEDLNFADLAAIRKAGLYLGVSTHNNLELDNAIAICPSYIALGHIFPTKTKHMSSKPQGLIILKQQLARLKDISTVAIGGISIKRAPAVLATGVGGIAVVSAITKAPNWQVATQQLLSLVKATEILHIKTN